MRGWVCLFCLLAGILLPTIIFAAYATIPNTLLATGEVGAFESSTVSVGGFFAPTVTTVQTTAATIAVAGQFSASRGQVLRLEKRTKDGLLLCTHNQHRVCAGVASKWPGPLRKTGNKTSLWAFAANPELQGNIPLWLMVGFFSTLISAGAWAVSKDGKDGEEAEEAT